MTIASMFEDAHRRVCIAKQRGETDRDRIWTGMAMPYEAKPLIDKGWMKLVVNESFGFVKRTDNLPYGTPRVLNWYKFTEAGWAEYDRRYKGKPDYFAERSRE